jgi:uncharacterized metal-binding protein YceD (DUF177 family)
LALANEFPRPISTGSLPEGGAAFDVAATPEERRALARRFDLIGLESLTARGHVERVPAGALVRVSGALEAAVVQECVVTLEPVASTVRAPLERLYGDAPAVAAAPSSWDGAGEGVTVDPEEDEIEPLPAGGVIDLGEVVAEELALALDPYPRAPDALEQVADLFGRDDEVSLNAPEDARERPFAAALRRHRAG